MTSLKEESTKVPSINGEIVDITPGDIWPLPFRGSRYTIKKVEDRLRFCWTHQDVVHCSDDMPKGLIQAMLKHKWDNRGSIRITPNQEVIAKRYLIKESIWKPVYIGKIDGVYTFPGFKLDPSSIQTGNLWPGFHFKHGEEFAVWNRDGNDDYLYWTYKGLYFRTIGQYPELCSKVREIRPRCGRIYVTEFGHVWMNLPGNEVSYEWRSKFNRLLQEDKKMLETNNDILLRSVYGRVKATKTYPVYLGKISDFDSGVIPRTHFSAGAKFGIGGEDFDDSDVYNAKGWKKMRRDH